MRLASQLCGFLFVWITCVSTGTALESAGYLPGDANFDTDISSPESMLGWEIGDWRIHHPALVQYLQQLAEESDRVSIKVTGYTHEQRPLLQLIITSAENQSKLESLRQAHLQGVNDGDLDAPLVVWLGYSVHGNEASGSNAAPLVAWYLAASRSEYVKELLENTIVIIDPSLNPDGLDRFSSWSNSNSSKTPVGDRNGRIHREDWPQGRTNHYLFDLNRDWLPLVHPESRARITEYHRWLPHVLTDHHETRHDGFFFQPGVPTRQHPLTTRENLEMTRALAGFHAKSLDSAGTMFFTEDTYDDFYYGKGSTYPDINGSIGILFEQPRINGALYNRDSGPLTFTEAIHNQVRTSLSTLEGAHTLSDELKKYQTGFFQAMQTRADKSGFQGWIIGDGGDPARARAMLDVFKHHQVEYHALKEKVSANGLWFTPQHAWVIPVKQRQFGLLQAMIEKRTKFEDDTFYDVSAWSLPLAYNLPHARLKRIPATGEEDPVAETLAPETDAVAWIISWQQMNAPAVLQNLLDAGAIVRAATKPFTAGKTARRHTFNEGSLVILSGIQQAKKSAAIFEVLKTASDRGVNVHSFNTQLTAAGPGLGTDHFIVVPGVQPLLIVGEGTSSYAVGEAWYQLDQHLGLAPVMVNLDRLKNVRLHDYTHLLMVDGSYKTIDKKLKKNIADWINDGGILVTSQRASGWAESLCFSSGDCENKQVSDKEEPINTEPLAYGDFDQKKAEKVIGGAIVAALVDKTHPVAFGYEDKLPLFRKGTTLLKPSDNPFSTPIRYAQDPLISGYIGQERLQEMSKQPAAIAERHQKGAVIRFANNPLFRGFWRGNERMWVNALYFGPLIKKTELPE